MQLRWTRPREGSRTARRAATFGDLPAGQVGLIVDSYGLLAVCVPRGSAADLLGLEAGDELTLVPLDDDEPDQPGGDGDGGVTTPVTLHRRKPSRDPERRSSSPSSSRSSSAPGPPARLLAR